MAKRLRMPMVGDRPKSQPVEPLAPPSPSTQEVGSSFDPDEFNWGKFEEFMVACLVIHNSVEGLVDMWKSNANMLDWAKKVAPTNWQRIRDAFARRKSALTGD